MCSSLKPIGKNSYLRTNSGKCWYTQFMFRFSGWIVHISVLVSRSFPVILRILFSGNLSVFYQFMKIC